MAKEKKIDKTQATAKVGGGKGTAVLDPSLALIKHQTERLGEIYKTLMQEGTDYGVIPGTKRPSLWKPGAELLRVWRGYIPEFKIEAKEVNLEKGIFHYEISCTLYKAYVINPSGQVVTTKTAEEYLEAASRPGNFIAREVEGVGFGSANSLEGKYRFRWLPKSKLPVGLDAEKLVKRFQFFKGKSYPQYRVDNENPQDLGNTILKQSKKRAFIDAILNATGASRIFTQDIGEEPEVEGEEATITVEGAEVESTETEPGSEEVVTISE